MFTVCRNEIKNVALMCKNSAGHESGFITWPDDVTPVSVSATPSIARHHISVQRSSTNTQVAYRLVSVIRQLSIMLSIIYGFLHTCLFFVFFVCVFLNFFLLKYVLLACSFIFFCILWVTSIVDLRVFEQPGSIINVLNCHDDCHVFESNKYLLLLLRT